MTMPNKRVVVIFSLIFMSMVIYLKPAKAEEAAAQVSPQAANKIEYKSEGLRDPFEEEEIETKEEPQAQPKLLPALQVQGIVWGGSLPQAIINNKVVRVGDTIEGVRIADINKSGVAVFFDNRQYNLSTSAPMPISSQGSKDNNMSLRNQKEVK